MTDKSDYTAKIRAKGLSSTGVTEDLAKTFYHQLGSHHLFIVEGRVDRRTENGDGTHTSELILTQVEPSTAAFVDDHLRELMRAMYRNRALAEGAIPETMDGPDVRDVVKGSGEAIMERDEQGNPDRLWDGNTDGTEGAAPSGSCAFPGCGLEPEHEGDHDVFTAPASDDAEHRRAIGQSYADQIRDEDAEDVYPEGHPNAGMAVEHPEPGTNGKARTKKLAAVPDPFASSESS